MTGKAEKRGEELKGEINLYYEWFGSHILYFFTLDAFNQCEKNL